MKIQYCSDLHLEFAANNQFLKKNPLVPTGEVLLLAGDIITFPLLSKYSRFFDFISDSFRAVYWIPGNHEYYGFDIAHRCGSFCEQIRKNVFLLNNEVIELGDIRFVFSTMWSTISPVNHWTVQQNISDFHSIKYNGGRFNPNHFNQLHEQSKDFIRSALQAEIDTSRTVVVTHHVPTFLNYPSEFSDSPVNEAFVAELRNLIDQTGPAFWVYGHHHRNISPFLISNTQLITNQLGYVQLNEHGQFNFEAFIDL